MKHARVYILLNSWLGACFNKKSSESGRNNNGAISADDNTAWASYWAPHFGEELGTSMATNPSYYT
ncbi:hypothetical protein [Saccharicrinis carchari]|uniref:hypothetical protein n=1 Tax=Saccharicrinis carchari TaxID=1168039 RepID=UPI001158B300|nr:hypothetical protein [Saccharicrinis carchari]